MSEVRTIRIDLHVKKGLSRTTAAAGRRKSDGLARQGRALAAAAAAPPPAEPSVPDTPASPPHRRGPAHNFLDQVFGPSTTSVASSADGPQAEGDALDQEIALALQQAKDKQLAERKRKASASRPQQPRAGVRRRPTLSDQLSAIGATAGNITKEIRTKHGLAQPAEPELRVPALKFEVGTLTCKFPAPVEFFPGHCSYVFNHPFEAKQITMLMYYRDMMDAALSVSRRELRFRIHGLLDKYIQEYDPCDPRHLLRICLASENDTRAVAALGMRNGLRFREVP